MESYHAGLATWMQVWRHAILCRRCQLLVKTQRGPSGRSRALHKGDLEARRRLRDLSIAYPGDWTAMSKHLPRKTPNSIMVRWKNIGDPLLARNQPTVREQSQIIPVSLTGKPEAASQAHSMTISGLGLVFRLFHIAWGPALILEIFSGRSDWMPDVWKAFQVKKDAEHACQI